MNTIFSALALSWLGLFGLLFPNNTIMNKVLFIKKDAEASSKTHDFNEWFMQLDVLCMDMFLNSWESLGGDIESAKAEYNAGYTVDDVCADIMAKYNLTDVRSC